MLTLSTPGTLSQCCVLSMYLLPQACLHFVLAGDCVLPELHSLHLYCNACLEHVLFTPQHASWSQNSDGNCSLPVGSGVL